MSAFVASATSTGAVDPADGRYRLLDFNPRLGAQFRLFETTAGVDVVRAMHLDLTGRPIPPGGQVDGRGVRVENLDIPALWAYRRRSARTAVRRPPSIPRHRTEPAWLAIDDPLPAAAAAARSAASAAAMLTRRLRQRSKTGQQAATPGGSGK